MSFVSLLTHGTGTGLPSEINEEFDKFGADGWELVTTEGIVRPAWFYFSKCCRYCRVSQASIAFVRLAVPVPQM
jgi:hypothetical protein